MTAVTTTRKRRSQLMLDEDLYRRLVEEAEREGCSVSSLVRQAVAQWLAGRVPGHVEETPFWPLVGQGRSGQTGEHPISENVKQHLYPAPPRRSRRAK